MAKQKSCPAHCRKIHVTVDLDGSFYLRWRRDNDDGTSDYPQPSAGSLGQLHRLVDRAVDDVLKNIRLHGSNTK